MNNINTWRGVTQIWEGFYRSGFNLTQDASKPQNTRLSGHALTYNGHKGFTLIELLVVVLIIGILAAVALPQYQKAVDRAKYKQAVLAVRAIVEAEQLYYLSHGTIATDLSKLDLTFGGQYKKNSGIENNSITFDWGSCSLTSWQNSPTCIINSPYMLYRVSSLPHPTKQYCVADVESSRAIAACQAEFPNASYYDSSSHCTSRTCRVFSKPWP